MVELDEMFTEQEIALEERRMARERRRVQLAKATLFGAMALLSASNLYLFVALEDLVWPVWVDAMAVFPGTPWLHWQLMLANFTIWTLDAPVIAFLAWRKRHPPRDEDWTYRAVARLTHRGGLQEADDG